MSNEPAAESAVRGDAEPDDGVDRAAHEPDDDLPPFTEQLSEQLGGVRGIIESGIPVAVFVIVNVLWEDGLRWAIIAAVSVAVVIAVMRALRREPIRHAVNGLFGIGLGAWLAWRSGDQGDFYIPGIIQGFVVAALLIGSALIRQPLVGWFWSIIAGGGKKEWREDAHLVRVFSWLTLLWGVVFLAKNIARLWLKLADMDAALGLVTLFGGYPVTAVLVAITLWSIRRTRPSLLVKAEPAPESG